MQVSDQDKRIANADRFHESLLNWYDNNARAMPWRQNPTAYNVWISEVMLQQTRVETVIAYYERFVAEISSVQQLAQVDEDRLLKLWQGLGYYSRARNLKRTAQILLSDYDGQLPDQFEELITLPGIGAYTAGAIASIAFQKPVAAVDGNVFRVLIRLIASQEDIHAGSTKTKLREIAAKLICEDRPGQYNQAMMELGATVCVPGTAPHCPECPVSHFCLAFQTGQTNRLPYRSGKPTRAVLQKSVLVLVCSHRIAIRKRPCSGLLPGLWEFLLLDGQLDAHQCRQYLESHKIKALSILDLGPSRHVFSHLEWHMVGFKIEVADENFNADWQWVSPEDIQDRYSIPSAYMVYLRKLFA